MQVYITGLEKQGSIAGKHLIIEAVGSEQHLLNDQKLIRESLIAAANAGKFAILDMSVHRLEPRGVTGYALLAESHISVHTWPQHNYAAIDIFTCSDKEPMLVLNVLKSRLKLEKIKITSISRGKGTHE